MALTDWPELDLYTPCDWIGLVLIALFIITRDASVRRWLGLD